MTARAIVRDDGVLSGRWHFEGTSIPIATIVSDSAYGQDEVKEQYRFMALTDEEIVAALAFPFPPIRDVAAFLEYAAITVACVCGEDTHKAAISPEIEVIACPCRRVWEIDVTLRLQVDGPPA